CLTWKVPAYFSGLRETSHTTPVGPPCPRPSLDRSQTRKNGRFRAVAHELLGRAAKGGFFMARRSTTRRAPELARAPEPAQPSAPKSHGARPLTRALPRSTQPASKPSSEKRPLVTRGGADGGTPSKPPIEDVERMMEAYTPLVRQIAGG